MAFRRPPRPVDPKVRRAALGLLRRDAALDDSVFTPPGAMGLAVDVTDSGEASTDEREE